MPKLVPEHNQPGPKSSTKLQFPKGRIHTGHPLEEIVYKTGREKKGGMWGLVVILGSALAKQPPWL